MSIWSVGHSVCWAKGDESGYLRSVERQYVRWIGISARGCSTGMLICHFCGSASRAVWVNQASAKLSSAAGDKLAWVLFIPTNYVTRLPTRG